MQALHLEEWPCCNGATKTDWKNLTGTQAKVQGLRKGARQLKSCKPLRKTQGQTSFLDRHVRNMENRRGPLNRRIKRYSILQQLNFGDSSHALSVKHYSQNFCRLALGENDRRTSDSDLLQIVGRCRCLPFPPMVLYRNICVHPQVAATIVSAWEILERSWWHLGTWSGA